MRLAGPSTLTISLSNRPGITEHAACYFLTGLLEDMHLSRAFQNPQQSIVPETKFSIAKHSYRVTINKKEN